MARRRAVPDMPRRRDDRPATGPAARPFLVRMAWGTIVFWIVALPLLVSLRGKETFRVPKDLLFIGEGVVLAGLTLLAAINFKSPKSAKALLRHPVVLVGAAALLWTTVTTLTSTNRSLSAGGLVWMTAAVIIGVTLTAFASIRTISAMSWAQIPAVINAIVFLLQRFRIWSPIHFDPTTPEHMLYTALIGNPDDVGSFLVAPTIISLVLAI